MWVPIRLTRVAGFSAKYQIPKLAKKAPKRSDAAA
jgi:hypothetical protein